LVFVAVLESDAAGFWAGGAVVLPCAWAMVANSANARIAGNNRMFFPYMVEISFERWELLDLSTKSLGAETRIVKKD
jgi:hypothetical protein